MGILARALGLEQHSNHIYPFSATILTYLGSSTPGTGGIQHIDRASQPRSAARRPCSEHAGQLKYFLCVSNSQRVQTIKLGKWVPLLCPEKSLQSLPLKNCNLSHFHRSQTFLATSCTKIMSKFWGKLSEKAIQIHAVHCPRG